MVAGTVTWHLPLMLTNATGFGMRGFICAYSAEALIQ